MRKGRKPSGCLKLKFTVFIFIFAALIQTQAQTAHATCNPVDGMPGVFDCSAAPAAKGGPCEKGYTANSVAGTQDGYYHAVGSAAGGGQLYSCGPTKSSPKSDAALKANHEQAAAHFDKLAKDTLDDSLRPNYERARNSHQAAAASYEPAVPGGKRPTKEEQQQLAQTRQNASHTAQLAGASATMAERYQKAATPAGADPGRMDLQAQSKMAAAYGSVARGGDSAAAARLPAMGVQIRQVVATYQKAQDPKNDPTLRNQFLEAGRLRLNAAEAIQRGDQKAADRDLNFAKATYGEASAKAKALQAPDTTPAATLGHGLKASAQGVTRQQYEDAATSHQKQAEFHTNKAKELQDKDPVGQLAHLNAAASHGALQTQYKNRADSFDAHPLTEEEHTKNLTAARRADDASKHADDAAGAKDYKTKIKAAKASAENASSVGQDLGQSLLVKRVDTESRSEKATTATRTEQEALQEHRKFQAASALKQDEHLELAHKKEEEMREAEKANDTARAQTLRTERDRHLENAEGYRKAGLAHGDAVRNLERVVENEDNSRKGAPKGATSKPYWDDVKESRRAAFNASDHARALSVSEDPAARQIARNQLNQEAAKSRESSAKVGQTLTGSGYAGGVPRNDDGTRKMATMAEMKGKAPDPKTFEDLEREDQARRTLGRRTVDGKPAYDGHLGEIRAAASARNSEHLANGGGQAEPNLVPGVLKQQRLSGSGAGAGGAGGGGAAGGSGLPGLGSAAGGAHLQDLDPDDDGRPGRYSVPGAPGATMANRRVNQSMDDCSTAATIDNKMGCNGINRLTQGAQMIGMMTMMGVGSTTSAMGMAGQQYAMDQNSQKAALEAAANTQINTGIAETSAGGLSTMMGVFQLAAAAKKLSDAKKLEQAGQASNYDVKLAGTENHEGTGIHNKDETGYVSGKTTLSKQVVDNLKLNENSGVHFTQVQPALMMTPAERQRHDADKAQRQQEAQQNLDEVASQARQMTGTGAGELRQAASGAMMGGLQSMMMGGQQVASGATQIAAGKELLGRIGKMTQGHNPAIVNQDMPGFAGFGSGQTFAAPGAISGAGAAARDASESPTDFPSSTPPDLGMGFDPNPLGTGVPDGQAPGRFVAGDGSGGGGGANGSYSPGGDTSAAPATDSGNQQPALSGDTGIVAEGGGHGAYAGGGGGAGKGADGGPDLSSLLAKFLPQKEEADKKGNSIMDFSGKGGVQGVYTPLDRHVNIFQRVSETYQDKQMRGNIGG